MINITWLNNSYKLNDHSDYRNGYMIVNGSDKPERIDFDKDEKSIKIDSNKYGIIDLAQNIIIPLEYNFISPFRKYYPYMLTRVDLDFIDINNNIIISSDDFFISHKKFYKNEYINYYT